MNKLWLDVFAVVVAPGENVIDILVMRIKNLLNTNKSVIREKLPTQREIVAETQHSEAIIRHVAKTLKTMRIIEARSGGGTYFVNRKARNQKTLKNEQRESGSSYDVDEVQLGEEVLLQSATAVSNFRKKWNAATKKNSTLSPEQLRVKIIPEVITHTRQKLSYSLGIDYSDSQIYYSSGYQSTLYCTFMALLNNRKKIIVTLGMINETAVKTIFDVRPGSHVLSYDAAGKDLDKLEVMCFKQLVGIVYISSRRVAPVNYEIDAERAARIHALRDTYKFVIVEDDRDVSYFQSSENLLMSTTTSKYESLVYLRPYSSFLPFINDLNLLCGPAKLIRKIRDKFRVSGKDISAAVSLSLNELLGKELFFKSETIVLNKIADIMVKVRENLSKSGIWTAESIAAGSACFLRLQPKYGNIPPDGYSHFKRERIRIIAAAAYAGDETALEGILISLVASIDGECLDRDLNKFNEAARRIIC